MSANHGSHSGDDHVHVVPVPVLAGVFALLIVLTGVTVAATWVDLGTANIWLAMGIATVKGIFVLLYFMHLRYDRAVNSIIFISALLFVLLFVGITLMDTMAYHADLIPGYAPALNR